MREPFRVKRRVEFRDTDAAGIVHFSMYYLYMEAAEHAFWRQLGMGIVMKEGDQILSWPRVVSRCEYFAPLVFEEEVDIEVRLIRRGKKSITYDFPFHRGEQLVARGEVTAVCCQIVPDEPPSSIEIPTWMAEKLDAVIAS